MTFNISAFDISASALSAQSTRMEVISQNIANADTILTDTGLPYQRKVTIFESANNEIPFFNYFSDERDSLKLKGVTVASIVADESPFKTVYDPENPLADENGNVIKPNVDTTTEMIDMMDATRAYEANITVFNAIKTMLSEAIDIGK